MEKYFVARLLGGPHHGCRYDSRFRATDSAEVSAFRGIRLFQKVGNTAKFACISPARKDDPPECEGHPYFYKFGAAKEHRKYVELVFVEASPDDWGG